MTHASGVADSPAALRAAWQKLKHTSNVRARDAAKRFGVSEAELVAAGCGQDAVRLDGDFRQLTAMLPTLGRVMALTRNDSCVHERVGQYEDVSANGWVGLVLGPDIDLRVFYRNWRFGYALEEQTPRGPRHSFQFFDRAGGAVHKVYLRSESDIDAYRAIVRSFRAGNQAPGETVDVAEEQAPPAPDESIDVAGLRAGWSAMQDTHEFFGLLKRFGVAREQALRLAGSDFAVPLAQSAPRLLLETAARTELPIMVFVGNPGVIQIHTGPVSNVRVMGPWLNVMDPDFNLHLREDQVRSVWLVRKPTAAGIVTSVELFDAAGRNIALLFGKRKPGIPESETWRAAAAKLPLAVDAKA
jgi:putative hemin transport protein